MTIGNLYKCDETSLDTEASTPATVRTKVFKVCTSTRQIGTVEMDTNQKLGSLVHKICTLLKSKHIVWDFAPSILLPGGVKPKVIGYDFPLEKSCAEYPEVIATNEIRIKTVTGAAAGRRRRINSVLASTVQRQFFDGSSEKTAQRKKRTDGKSSLHLPSIMTPQITLSF